jgi:toxin ParE1/3/4
VSGYRLRPKAALVQEAIGDFIAADDPVRAVAFIDEMLSLCSRIEERPQAFPRRDDLAQGLRQAVHGRYLIMFSTAGDSVVIERVLHGARRLEDLI